MWGNKCDSCGGKGYIVAYDLITLIEEAAFSLFGMPPRRRPCRKCRACWGTGAKDFNRALQWRKWRSERW